MPYLFHYGSPRPRVSISHLHTLRPDSAKATISGSSRKSLNCQDPYTGSPFICLLSSEEGGAVGFRGTREEVDVRESQVPHGGTKWEGWSYGAMECGSPTYGGAFAVFQYQFCTGSTHPPTSEDCKVADAEYVHEEGRFPASVLVHHRVDVLLVGRGHWRKKPRVTRQPTSAWFEAVHRLENKDISPRVIVEIGRPEAATWTQGPMDKTVGTQWSVEGYETHCKAVDLLEVGGAIQQSCLVVRTRVGWTWTETRPLQYNCGMSNLLTPGGLIRKVAYWTGSALPAEQITDYRAPMPDGQALIYTEQGIQRIQPEEWGRGLGIEKNLRSTQGQVTTSILRATTSVFLWEYVGHSLAQTIAPTATNRRAIDQIVNRTNNAVEATPTGARPAADENTGVSQPPFV
ncbi:hypothetical protein ACA910_007376 [Epithemia clementina (nom. ined.)]